MSRQRPRKQRQGENQQVSLEYIIIIQQIWIKLSLRSGTNVQREMSNRDRRKMMRDERRTRSHSATRLTSSTDPMDTDEAARITRNVLSGTGTRLSRRASSDGDDTIVGSDLDQTVLEKKSQEEKRKPDGTKGLRNPEPTKEPTGRPALNTSSIFQDKVPLEERSLRLTFGLSPSLIENKDETLMGAVGGSEEGGDLIPDYSGNDFLLTFTWFPHLVKP